MSKITKAHIRAARARQRVLRDRGKPVPKKIEQLAGLDLSRYPSRDPEKPSLKGAEASHLLGFLGGEKAKAESRFPTSRHVSYGHVAPPNPGLGVYVKGPAISMFGAYAFKKLAPGDVVEGSIAREREAR